jgi:hypothetical protein
MQMEIGVKATLLAGIWCNFPHQTFRDVFLRVPTLTPSPISWPHG